MYVMYSENISLYMCKKCYSIPESADHVFHALELFIRESVDSLCRDDTDAPIWRNTF